MFTWHKPALNNAHAQWSRSQHCITATATATAWCLETIYFMSAIAPATEQIQLPITSHAVMQPTVKQSPGPQSVVSRVVWSDYEL